MSGMCWWGASIEFPGICWREQAWVSRFCSMEQVLTRPVLGVQFVVPSISPLAARGSRSPAHLKDGPPHSHPGPMVPQHALGGVALWSSMQELARQVTRRKRCSLPWGCPQGCCPPQGQTGARKALVACPCGSEGTSALLLLGHAMERRPSTAVQHGA